MKTKLLQILLGAIGSALTVLVGYLANMPADVTAGAALSAGPVATTLLGGFVNTVTGQG